MRFFDWDHRPAVVVGGKAFAVLSPGAAWTSVDEFDVTHTAADLSEEAWRRTFIREFGPLDTWRWRPGQDNIPQSRPLPRAKDFDDAARMAARVAKLAHADKTEPVSKKTYDLDNSPDEIETRVILATMARRRLAREAAKSSDAPSKKIYDLENSPESVENRGILEMLHRWADSVEAKAKAKSSEAPSKKTYDPGDKSPEAVAHRLHNSPESVENRAMESMFAHLRSEREAKAKLQAACLARTADLAHQIATSPLSLVLEIDGPPIAP
jgi:hypothetical protein